ncbi:unnamed protein product [Spirodela intermedia]|uniref:Uncharacterized protein n=1 Tax=Spirodela intermedia TaxID=51605 RepID=A0A7I8IJ63_SPIIN|nr:unnamed protein product [Spirodela intermedia]CAA6657877.1 unnamed protein product [Spirodela intermedia]
MEQIRQENQQTFLRLEKEIDKLALAHSKCKIDLNDHDNDHKNLFSDDENLEEEKKKSKEEKYEVPPIPILSQQDELKKIVPFPMALEPKLRKRAEPNEELMEIFKQVHISIPLIDAIKHIPMYAKNLKELCTPHRSPWKISLSEEANLFKTPKGLLEDVIIHVKGYRFLVDFLILHIPILDNLTHAPIILGCPFLATAKANIDCENGIINMKYEGQNISLNVFKSSRFLHEDNDNYEDIDVIDSCIEKMNYVQQVDQLILPFHVHALDQKYYRKEALDYDITFIESSLENPPSLELKPLPHLLNFFFGPNQTLPMIISTLLTSE